MKNMTPVVFIVGILWMFSPDKQLFAIAAMLLLFLVKFSWREDEPKIVFLGMIFYWLSVCTLMIYGIFFNKPMIESTLSPDTFIYTTYLALFANFCYCVGMLLAIRSARISTVDTLFQELKKYNARKLLIFYSLYSVFSSLFSGVVLSFGGLSQLGVGIIWLKWAFLTILIIHTLLFPSNQKYVYIVLLIEVVMSFTGFWSSFKDYLFIAGAAFLTFSATINPRRVFALTLGGIAAFFLMVMWTVVKGEYRQYLTGGKRSQIVEQQSSLANLQKLSDLFGQYFNRGNFSENFSNGVDALAQRINYTEYFAMSVAHVPAILPFEGGALLEAGFEHVFKPRLFFPNKKTIDDSEMTSKYTGRKFAGEEQGTSFSLGLVAERYIDYGPLYMFIPIFLFGLLIGLIYKYILTHSLNKVWGVCFVAPLFFFIPSLGLATTKFLGWLFTYLIVWFLFNKFLLKRVDSYLRKDED